MQFINECVIGHKTFKDGTVLFKNRDRNYLPDVELVHEIVDGVEVLYMHDIVTGWLEGINEYGICAVNSTLMVVSDENAVVLEVDPNAPPNITKDGDKMLYILASKNIKQALNRTKAYKNNKDKEDKEIYGLALFGHTIISDGVTTYKVEGTKKHAVKHERLDDKMSAFTNHGDLHEEAGYKDGVKRTSSDTRMFLAKLGIKKSRTKFSILKNLGAKNEGVPAKHNPLRYDGEDGDLYTTSQILLDPADRRLTFRYNDDICTFKGIRVNLPSNYTPKLKLKLITLQ